MIEQAIGPLGVPELLIILAVVLLLFGGSRLAGIGRSSGRAIREFKEETRDLRAEDEAKKKAEDTEKAAEEGPKELSEDVTDEVAEAEIVEPQTQSDDQR